MSTLAAATSGVVPEQAARIVSRLATPGFSSGQKRTSRPESVTARETLRRMASGGSSSRTVPGASGAADLLIFLAGSCRSMTRAPTGGVTARGTTNVSPYRWLNRMARSRASSRCCR